MNVVLSPIKLSGVMNKFSLAKKLRIKLAVADKKYWNILIFRQFTECDLLLPASLINLFPKSFLNVHYGGIKMSSFKLVR